MFIDSKYGLVTLEKKKECSDDSVREPVFVLRGQDILAPAAVYAYANLVEASIPGLAGKNTAARIRERAGEMAAWGTRKLPD